MIDNDSWIHKFLKDCAAHGFTVEGINGRHMGPSHRAVHWNLTHDDGRYEDEESAIMLETAMRNKAIVVERIAVQASDEEVTDIIKNDDELRISSYSSTQQIEKVLMAKAMRQNGYVIDGYEGYGQTAPIGRTDVTAHKGTVEIVGECATCRIDKVGHTLGADGEGKQYELWHLPTWRYHGDTERLHLLNGWIDTTARRYDASIYIYRKGPNWNKLIEIQLLPNI